MTGRLTAVIAAIGVLVALPAAAGAKTKTVDMGIPPASGKAFQKAGVDVNDYFPHGVTVNKGDKVKFLPVGFHSFDFPARGGEPLPLISPTGEKVAGVNDAAGSPFWFNGQDQVGFTAALAPGHVREAALLHRVQADHERPAAGREAQAGHGAGSRRSAASSTTATSTPGMKGTVTVRPKGRRVPSKRADERAVKRQLARSLKAAKQLPKATRPANTVNVGVAGRHGEEFFGFVPNAMTIPTGTTLNFRMSPGSYDVHTATTGPGNPEQDETSYLGEIAAGFNSPVFDPRGVYPSEQPPATGTLTPALHGNGFWNTGVMDTAAGTPLPASNSVTFGAPGTYEFYCLIHPFMHATVTVQ